MKTKRNQKNQKPKKNQIIKKPKKKQKESDNQANSNGEKKKEGKIEEQIKLYISGGKVDPKFQHELETSIQISLDNRIYGDKQKTISIGTSWFRFMNEKKAEVTKVTFRFNLKFKFIYSVIIIIIFNHSIGANKSCSML